MRKIKTILIAILMVMFAVSASWAGGLSDRITWKATWTITKFADPTDEIATALQHGASIDQFQDKIIGIEKVEHNLGLNEGLAELIDLAIGAGTPTAWDNSNAYLGVGDSSTAASASQTGLQASTNKLYKAMDSTYPQRSSQTAEWRSTFGSAEANFQWYEFSVSNGSDDTGVNLNRKVEDKGTKASGETWTLALQITFS